MGSRPSPAPAELLGRGPAAGAATARPWRWLALALSAAALAGCGSSVDEGIESKTPTEILAASQLAADAAASVHVAGAIVSGGQPLTFDLSLLANSGARGTLSEMGASFEVIRVANTIYIKGSEAFYRRLVGPSAARLLAGRWLKAPASSQGFASLAALTDLRTLIDTTFANHGRLQKGSTTTLGGVSAIALKDRSRGGTIYIATTGLPYPLQVLGGRIERRSRVVQSLERAGGVGGARERDRNKPPAIASIAARARRSCV